MLHIIIYISGAPIEIDEDCAKSSAKDIQSLDFQLSCKEILLRLRKLVLATGASPQRVHHYRSLCKELDMKDQNLLIEDVPTRWNSTFEMIEAAWEKRKVLDKMAIDYLNTNKVNYSIRSEEWDI